MQRIRAMWASGTRGKIMLLVGGLLGICVICSVITSLFPRTPATQTASAPSQPGAQPTLAAAVPKATDAPKVVPPTNTPVPPTAAPAPKATDVPKPAPTQPPTAAPKVAPTQPPPTAAPATGKVGETVEVNGVKLTVHKVERRSDLSQFQKAKESRAFIVAEVTVENTGQPEHDHNPIWFKVRDSDGQQYNITFGGQDPFSTGKIAKGDKVRGNVFFDVKADAKGFTLIYDTIPLANAARQIRFDLGQ